MSLPYFGSQSEKLNGIGNKNIITSTTNIILLLHHNQNIITPSQSKHYYPLTIKTLLPPLIHNIITPSQLNHYYHITFKMKRENENLYWDEKWKTYITILYLSKENCRTKLKKINLQTHVTKELKLHNLVVKRMTLRSAGPCET